MVLFGLKVVLKVFPFRRLARNLTGTALLALLVAVAQFGAARHELGHAVDEVVKASTTGQSPASGYHLVCDLCVAFGHVATAIGSSASPLAVQAIGEACPLAVAELALAASAVPPRSRGPPYLL